MRYRNLGASGLMVSALSFGSWVTFNDQIDSSIARPMLFHAYDAGINFFDNAEAYSHGESERIMGAIISDAKWSRDSFIVSSKVFFGSVVSPKPTQIGLSRKHIVEACHQALQRLRVDYLDLYYCHRPDTQTPIVETVRAMSDLIQQGKVLYWGTSEWSAAQIMEAYSAAREWGLTPPTMEQPQYNLLHRDRVEKEYKHLYTQIGLGTTIWSPLASGILTGKYSGGKIPPDSRLAVKGYKWLRDAILKEQYWKIERAQELKKFAEANSLDLTQLSIAWCLKNPHVSTVILGASRLEQLTHNIDSLKLVDQLDDTLLQNIEEIVQNKPSEDSF